MAAGTTCQYNFTFKPTQTGSFETTSSSSTNAGPIVIKLKGTGVGPRLWVTPLELDFGTVVVGATSAPLTVTITNLGLSTLTNFAGGAPFDTQFGASQNCAAGVAAGASCQYTFTFKPARAGVFETTSSSSTNAGPFVIKLRGNTPPGP
ncbi:MAG: choice-of-anchor D domain-containing protein [Meiothermus sp.]|nr:choice-of-anchor D domain-containing protein [Meiothermus sp.]